MVYIDNHSFKIGKDRYGKLAYRLAKKCLEDKYRYQDYFENKDTYSIFFINTKEYGIKEVLVDTEDVVLFYDRKISVSFDDHTNTFYAKTKDGATHRLIMKAPEKTYIDHLNHDTLDNRKENLRIVTNSVNQRNASIRKDNKTGVKGVSERETYYYVFYVDKNGKRIQKSFSFKKYGSKEKAFEAAVACRLQAEKENDYLPN